MKTHEIKAEENAVELRRLVRMALVARGVDPNALPPVETSADRVALGSSTKVELIEAMMLLDANEPWPAVWKVYVALFGGDASQHRELRQLAKSIVPRSMR